MSLHAPEEDGEEYGSEYDDDQNELDAEAEASNFTDESELAEMFAKVQTIQQEQNYHSQIPSAIDTSGPSLSIVEAASAPCSRTKSPTGSCNSLTSASSKKWRSPMKDDGIRTISRKEMQGAKMDILLGIKKPAIFEERLLQTYKGSDTIEEMKKKTVAAPTVIAERIEKLSAPKKQSPSRKFASDEDAKHCRFKPKKASKFTEGTSDETASTGHSFLARMEAAERNRQKRLEFTRGEQDYAARLDKKSCPKCGLVQSYAEYKDKKKKCSICGVEFRVGQAWGDVGENFISRMNETARVSAERKEKLLNDVIFQETLQRPPKSSRQLFYEKQMTQKNNQRTFLERNYKLKNGQTFTESPFGMMERTRTFSRPSEPI